jgi:hypothetical protein
VTGIRTSGPCTIDLTWAGGELTEVRILAERGGSRVIRYGETKVPVTLEPGSAVVLTGPTLTP